MAIPLSAMNTMTMEARDEMCHRVDTLADVRCAEMAGLLRFAEGSGLRSDRVSTEVEVSPQVVASRLRDELAQVLGAHAQIEPVAAGPDRPQAGFVVCLDEGASSVGRRLGLVNRVGQAVMGLPGSVVVGSPEVASAAWRGAFLASGVLNNPGRSAPVEVAAPSLQAAMALVNAARRCGVKASHRERRGARQVVILEPEDAVRMLTAMGAGTVADIWWQRWQRREARALAVHGAMYSEVNVRRAARAGVIMSARAQRALEILGDDAPKHLREAGKLRVTNDRMSLDELGQACDPPLSKDSIAGRIRRLLNMADRVARERGIPDTGSVVAREISEFEAGIGDR